MYLTIFLFFLRYYYYCYSVLSIPTSAHAAEPESFSATKTSYMDDASDSSTRLVPPILLPTGQKHASSKSALITAVTMGDCNLVKLLLGRGAPVNQATKSGRTAIHVACLYKFVTIVELLIRNGANVNSIDKYSFTPLKLSLATTAPRSIIKLLLCNGAQLDQINLSMYIDLISCKTRWLFLNPIYYQQLSIGDQAALKAHGHVDIHPSSAHQLASQLALLLALYPNAIPTTQKPTVVEFATLCFYAYEYLLFSMSRSLEYPDLPKMSPELHSMFSTVFYHKVNRPYILELLREICLGHTQEEREPCGTQYLFAQNCPSPWPTTRQQGRKVKLSNNKVMAGRMATNDGAEIRCAEFFSGLGGMHYALNDALKAMSPSPKCTVVAAFDINTIANTVYKHNFGICPMAVNLEHLPVEYFDKLGADLWLLSPPCQPFTRGGKMRDDTDPRSIGLLHLIKVLAEMQHPPHMLFLENVLNFEVSKCRDKLVDTLINRGYGIEEYLLTPMDKYVGIPNDRLRYYLIARAKKGSLGSCLDSLAGSCSDSCSDSCPGSCPGSRSDSPANDSSSTNRGWIRPEIIKSFDQVLANSAATIVPFSSTRPISEYLETGAEASDPKYLVPEKYLTEYKNYRHDITWPTSTRSTTFTKAYGSKYIIGTGSFLQTARLELTTPERPLYALDDPSVLVTLRLRFFTPREIARLHGFGDDFCFPPNEQLVTTIQQYRLLGNSLNIKVVSLLVQRLLSGPFSSTTEH